MIRVVSLAMAMAVIIFLPAASAEPAALVTLATARAGTLQPRIATYGTVVPNPNGLSSISPQHDIIVTAVLVRAGQVVRAGDPIVRVKTAPTALATYQQADSALSFAQKDLAHTRALYAEQLATNSQLAAALKAFQDAKSALVAQQRMGSGIPSQTLSATVSGIVTSIGVSPGDRVAAGTAIANIATRERLIVNLGLEPSAAGRVVPGDAVSLHSPQNVTPTLQGKVQSVDAMMDPKSRLVNAVVSVDASAASNLVLGAVLQADIATSAREGILVPHSALMTDAKGLYIFVAAHGIAHRRDVQVGLDTGRQALIAHGIKSGELVVTAGNAALQDGMHVRVH